MTISLKPAAAATALLAAGVAHAAIVTAVPGTQLLVKDDARGAASTNRTAAITITSATGALYFSNGQADPTVLPATRPTSVGGLVGALNVGGVSVTAIDGATKDEQFRTVGSLNKSTRTVVGVSAAITSLTADTATGAFSTVTTRGGATQTAYYKEGVLDGGIASVNNLSIDLTNTANVKVSGNLVGTALTNGAGSAAESPEYGPQTGYTGVIWDQAKISGPTSLPPAELIAAADGDISQLQARGYTLLGTDTAVVNGVSLQRFTVQANNLITNLQVTAGAFDGFAQTLGLVDGSTGYTTLNGVNGSGGWGVMKAAIKFEAYEFAAAVVLPPPPPPPPVGEIPEPESWALMAVGLVGLGWRARAKMQAAAAV